MCHRDRDYDMVLGELRRRVAVTSGESSTYRLRTVDIEITEIEDALFNDNSAVMMPDRLPGGEGEENGDEVRVSGLGALVLALRLLEMNPDKKVLVSGHCHSADSVPANYAISERRARNVLYLLRGQRGRWTRLSADHHTITDYQRIMKYFHDTRRWPCNPGGVDGDWGDNTARAVQRFFRSYNTFASENGFRRLPDNLYNRVRDHGEHKWPRQAWRAVFNLYNHELCHAMRKTASQLNSFRSSHVNFVSRRKRFVACGASFRKRARYRDQYKSETDDRVEILCFDRREAPRLNCPRWINVVHTSRECPMWNRRHYHLVFSDPFDLNAVAYHMKFMYFDRIKNQRLPVPNNLPIKAFAADNTELTTRITYSSEGVYTVKVLDDPDRDHIHFTFETENLWIRTANADATPELVELTAEEIGELSAVDRQKHYDLPVKWSSRNYWTRHGGNYNTGGRFETVVETTLTLKPYGSNTTSPDQPLVFSLDDIVLVGANRSQRLRDKRPNGSNLNLDTDSRYALFHIDYDATERIDGADKNMRRIKIYNQDPDETSFTLETLEENLITDVPGGTRVVYFCNGFYDVFDKRSREDDTHFRFSRGYVLGARLGVLDDTDVHDKKSVSASTASDRTNAYALPSCGNYDLHYFHNCAELDNKMLAYLFIHWSCRLTNNNVVSATTTINGGSAADVANHRGDGMKNAMDRLNKDYLIEKHEGDNDILIRPFHFMEAKNDTNGGAHKATVNIIANTDSAGGSTGAWMLPNQAQLRARDYQDDPNYFGASDPDNSIGDTDGSTYNVLTNHHEMGHATGNWDDYLYDYEDASNNTWNGLPAYSQDFTADGGPYTCDRLSRMRVNRTPRLRNFWKFVCWLHDASESGQDLHRFFHDTRFKITFKGSSHTHEFTLDDAYKNVATAAFRDDDHSLGTGGESDLILYKLGDDELAHLIHSGQVFNGILVVKTKLALKFINAPSASWTFETSRDWARSLNDEMKTMLQNKFRISCTADNDFQNIFVHFVPHFQVYTGGAPGNSNINIEVTYRYGSTLTASGSRIRADWGAAADGGEALRKRIIRRCFGKSFGTGDTADLTHTDFADIVSWVRTTCGDTHFAMSAL